MRKKEVEIPIIQKCLKRKVIWNVYNLLREIVNLPIVEYRVGGEV